MGNMAEKSYEDLDDLFAKLRLGVGKVRQSDPMAAEELKSLLTQLEYWVESLVVDSLKLKGLESAKRGAKGPPGEHPEKPAKK